MKLFSRPNCVVACIALFSMLFMQLAVASCICPMTMETTHVATSMAHCEGLDIEPSAHCDAHYASSETTKQSLDQTELPQVQQFAPAGMVVINFQVADATEFSATMAPTSHYLIRCAAPPISILHCCFRI